MCKKKLFIKLLLLPITLLLSSCGMNARSYSHNDRSSFSYKPASGSEIEDLDLYAKGRRIFDAFYDYQGYQNEYEYRDEFRLSDFPTITFIKNANGGFKTIIAGEEIASVDTIYVADVNFDGYKDLCIGRMIENEKVNYAVFVYDVRNHNKILDLNEAADGGSSKDYAFNIKDDLLVIESSYNCSLAALDRYGYFKNNNDNTVNVEWQKIQFEIQSFEEEIDEKIHLYQGSDSRQRYIVNTSETFANLYVYINFVGDYSTSPYGIDNLQYTTASAYDLTIDTYGVDYLAFSLRFKEEGCYDITFKVGIYQLTLRFEANNHLYELLEVA